MKLLTMVVCSLLLIGCAGSEEPAANTAPAFEDIPKIDVHSHFFEDIPELAAMMERVNLRIVNICVRGNSLDNLKLMEQRAEEISAKYPERFAFASTFDLTRREEADYHEQVAAWLDASYEAGAVMTKIWKEVGMEMKTPDGAYLMPDDPVLDPVYAHIASRGKPLLAHLAEPIAAWLPLDPENVHHGYYSTHPEWHLYGKEGYPTHEEILAARDRVIEKHPDLIFIGAHLGSMSHDVDVIADRLDRYPNLYVECSARTRDLTRQPAQKVRDFFEKYQDRIMYGVDITRFPERDGPTPPAERAAYAAEIEQRYRLDFAYYAGSEPVEMAGKTVEVLALPRGILDKFYHANAQRLIPGL